MELREIKKEVHSLLNIEENFKLFKQHWLKPLKKNSNQHLPFLDNLDQETKKELNQKLHQLKDNLNNIETSQIINDKLRHHARDLIELKLTNFNGDNQKSEVLTNQFLNDDFLNLKQTISQIKNFDEDVSELAEQYHEINELLQQKLSLEEVLFYLDLPHKLYLYNLVKTAHKQKTIVREMGRHFVSITREKRKLK